MPIYYYKQLNDSGEVIGVLTYDATKPNIINPLVKEITEEEYKTLYGEILTKFAPENAEATKADYLEALAEMGVDVE